MFCNEILWRVLFEVHLETEVGVRFAILQLFPNFLKIIFKDFHHSFQLFHTVHDFEVEYMLASLSNARPFLPSLPDPMMKVHSSSSKISPTSQNGISWSVPWMKRGTPKANFPILHSCRLKSTINLFISQIADIAGVWEIKPWNSCDIPKRLGRIYCFWQPLFVKRKLRCFLFCLRPRS